jgi:hypothetical protein
MPFFLYKTGPEPTGLRYTQVSEISLAGTSGPLFEFARRENTNKVSPFAWHATESTLLAVLGHSSDDNAIVIDLRPRDTDRVSLYRLCDVWGYSYDGWTPVSLRLQSLFVETAQPNPSDFKLRFIDFGEEHSFVAEFLYLQGGVREGTWNWGMVGRVNGALLWKDAFDYLTGDLRGQFA